MSERVALQCQECERIWKVSPAAIDPRCPRCGSVDFDLPASPQRTPTTANDQSDSDYRNYHDGDL